MQYNRENPDQPELDAGEIEERAIPASAGYANEFAGAVPAAEPKTTQRRYKAPATLKDAAGEPAEGIAEAQAAQLLGYTPATLGRYRRGGYVNPKLILTDSEERPQLGGRQVVWWNKTLTEAIASSATTEPLFVGKEG